MSALVEIIEERRDYPGVIDTGFDLEEHERHLFPGDIVPFPDDVAHKLVECGKAKYYENGK